MSIAEVRPEEYSENGRISGTHSPDIVHHNSSGDGLSCMARSRTERGEGGGIAVELRLLDFHVHAYAAAHDWER